MLSFKLKFKSDSGYISKILFKNRVSRIFSSVTVVLSVWMLVPLQARENSWLEP